MFTDYGYYKTQYRGDKIQTEAEYYRLSQEAGRYILKVTDKLDKDTQDCECALVDYLFSANAQGNIASESIPNAYSVSYKTSDNMAKRKEIDAILELYLGNKFSTVGIAKMIN